MKSKKQIREVAGLTIKQVARLSGLSEAAIEKFESDEQPLIIGMARTLAILYGVSEEYLLGGEPSHSGDVIVEFDPSRPVEELMEALNELPDN